MGLHIIILLLAVGNVIVDAKPHHNSNNSPIAHAALADPAIYRDLADLFHRAHMVQTKRCATLFDEGCSNGGIPGSNTDEEWLEGGLGRRSIDQEASNSAGVFKSLSDFFHRVHLVANKRCASLFDEGCANGGIPDSNTDEEWLKNGGPGKRRRCSTNLFDESCSNGGIPGSNGDEDWLNGNELGR